MAIRVSEVFYFVTDFEAAVGFYTEKLGMPLVKRHDWGFAIVAADHDTNVGLMHVKAWNPEWQDGDPLEVPRLVLKTDDLDEQVERLREAGVAMDPLKEGTIRSVAFRDPDGNPFFLWEDRESTL